VTRKKYLRAANGISILNLATLVLMILGLPIGYYLALFTSAVIDVWKTHLTHYFLSVD